MKKLEISNLTIFLSLLIAACSGGGGGAPAGPVEDVIVGDDHFEIRATQTVLDLSVNDGALPEGAVIEIVQSSIYDSSVSHGATFPITGVPYLPGPRGVDWPWSSVLDGPGGETPHSDHFFYVLVSEGEVIGGPYEVTIDVEAFLYVDSRGGDDGNDGSAEAPLKTITTAVSMAERGSIIKVLPGDYDEANGEVFPIVIDKPLSLIGDMSTSGGGSSFQCDCATTVRGAGEYYIPEEDVVIEATFVLRDDSGKGAVIAGLFLSGDLDGDDETQEGVTLVYMTGRGHEVASSLLFSGTVGVRCGYADSCKVTYCEVRYCLVGVYGHDSLGGNPVRMSSITRNMYGVYLELPNDLNLGTELDSGENWFGMNRIGLIFEDMPASPQDAYGNSWNEFPLRVLDPVNPNVEEHYDVLASHVDMVDARGGDAQ